MEKKRQEEIIDYIKTELLPEAVHNRCFCDAESREFVEFDSVQVEQLRTIDKEDDTAEHYRGRLIVNFSGEPKNFSLIIKLLYRREDNNDNGEYDRFLNEEMFYNKMTKKYDIDIYPKCYVADMGRYGFPVIVLEDLEARGYVGVNSKLDEDHLDLCLKAIGRFHRRGFELKATNFNSFREFYAKLIDARLDRQSWNDLRTDSTNRISEKLRKLKYSRTTGDVIEDNEGLRTICHGNLASLGHFFFRYENARPMDVKIVGWNGMRYCSIVDDLVDILRDNISGNDDLEKYLAVYIDADK